MFCFCYLKIEVDCKQTTKKTTCFTQKKCGKYIQTLAVKTGFNRYEPFFLPSGAEPELNESREPEPEPIKILV